MCCCFPVAPTGGFLDVRETGRTSTPGDILPQVVSKAGREIQGITSFVSFKAMSVTP